MLAFVQSALTRPLSPAWQIFALLLLGDLLLCWLHLLFAQSGSVLFHLDHEVNLPTTYQSFKLILFGGFFVYQLLRRRVAAKYAGFLWPLALFMIALGFDELLQIHENIYRLFEFSKTLRPEKVVDASLAVGYRSSLWILYYLPVFFAAFFWIGYWFRFFQAAHHHHFRLLLIAACTLLLVIGLEIYSSTGERSHHAYFWLTTIEETGEMIFASVLVAIGLLTKQHQVAAR